MKKTYKTDQEEFWAGEFGEQYIDRNKGEKLLASNLNFFNKALTSFNGTIFGPSDGALFGSSCVSIKIAPTPTAIAARAK